MFLICSLLAIATAEKGIFARLSSHEVAPLIEEPSAEWLLGEDEDSSTMPVTKSPTYRLPMLAVALLTFAFTLRRWGEPSPETREEVLSPSSPESRDVFGCTRLHLCAAQGSALEARKLLEAGASADAREAWEETLSPSRGGRSSLVQHLQHVTSLCGSIWVR